MSKGINLLGAEQQLSAKMGVGSRKLKILRAAAVWLLFGISGASVALFLFIALSPLPSVQEEERSALSTLSKYHADIAKILVINDRIKGSEMILAKRTDFDQTLDKIKERLPEDTSITGLSMNSQEIAITVTSSSLASLDAFLNSLIAATDAKEDFSRITLTRFFSNETTKTFSLTINVITL
jgi:Tfp pilus assembly protein PilN